ncbi:hypothetical protein VTN96DRAFT_8799 [Rasamsonia emersonii]
MQFGAIGQGGFNGFNITKTLGGRRVTTQQSPGWLTALQAGVPRGCLLAPKPEVGTAHAGERIYSLAPICIGQGQMGIGTLNALHRVVT